MGKVTTIGLDLAKRVLHVVGCDARGKVVSKRMLRRGQVLAYFAHLERCRVALEACAGAHYWGRELAALGFEVRLIPAQYVKPYVRGNKNDYNDALAIAEAAGRGEMRFVALKSAAQQDLQALHRLRQGCVASRTQLCNRIRGLVGEYGLVAPTGIAALRRRLPEWLEDGENGLSVQFRRLLARSYAQLQALEAEIAFYDAELARYTRQDVACQRLQTIPGFGPVVASVFRSQLGQGEAFRRGRDVSAALGLVPRQHSSGGKDTLLRISKRGDGYLRSLLVHGARAVVARAKHKTDRLSRWINRIRAERGYNKAVVALANKLARIGWAVLAHDTVYRAG
ncbi:MAG TPA: IS110 family transposase [Gammaproteobacteria bacterium]|nr:IS110 family transposase [Gammaproteobacteria bacterium]